MKANVELEFISKVREVSEKMQELSLFWQSNSKMLEDVSEGKGCISNESFDILAIDVYNWSLALINKMCQNDPVVFFDAYYKSLQK